MHVQVRVSVCLRARMRTCAGIAQTCLIDTVTWLQMCIYVKDGTSALWESMWERTVDFEVVLEYKDIRIN